MNDSSIVLTNLCPSVAYVGNPNAEVNVVTFAGLRKSGGYGIPAYEFVRTLSSFNANVLFVRDATIRWYNFGLEGFSTDVYDTAVAIRRTLAETFGEKPVICIGNSMGGFAALLFGELMGADLTIAVCPQTFIGKDLRRRSTDPRWAELLDHFEPTIPNLDAVLNGGCKKSLVIIGDRCAHDLVHAGVVASNPNVHLQIVPGANHDVNKRWKDADVLMSTYQRLIFSNLE